MRAAYSLLLYVRENVLKSSAHERGKREKLTFSGH